MIKLIITSTSAPATTRCFTQPSVIIGGEHALQADLKLTGIPLQDRHIQISQYVDDSKNSFFVTNLTNDPFVTLNNFSFGKQPIYPNDILQLGDISIRFEYEDIAENFILPQDSQSNDLTENFYFKSLENLENIKLRKRKLQTNPSKPYPDTYPFTKNPSLPSQEKAPLVPENSLPSHPPKNSLKDDYLSEYDDDETMARLKNHTPPQLAKNWRSFLTISASAFTIVLIIGGLLYLWISDQTGEEEIKAAKNVADVAMSLTYAQFKHITPQNQNWSHPEFIKNNLSAILATNYLPLIEVDNHGQFANCPYMLRIYSSHDLSQFLVIAQPSPSLIQWLIPKASIIVDSRIMEMRKIKDLKALNRLIVNSNNLDSNINEISNLVKQGELIPLSKLVSKAENQGLIPPKALSLMHPGAENFIYNAPRYYLFGETILNTSLNLIDKLTTTKEINLLQQELSFLVKFPNFILYSSDGIQHALQAQKALFTLAPQDKFLIAYLQLNAHGKITNTHLLMDDNPPDIAMKEKEPIQYIDHSDAHEINNLEYELAGFNSAENDAKSGSHQYHPQEVDMEDSLFLQLKAMANFRQSALKAITDETVDLLRRHTLVSQIDFINHFTKLQQKYNDIDREQKTKIFKKFIAITRENIYLPAAKFLEFIKAADLKALFQDYLLNLKQHAEKHPVSDEHIENQLKLIKESRNWQELDEHVTQTNQLLQFDHMPDEMRLITFQHTMRSLVIQKLNQFILSSTEALPVSSFAPDYLQTLTNILKTAWITDPDIHDFYIAEFELR